MGECLGCNRVLVAVSLGLRVTGEEELLPSLLSPSALMMTTWLDRPSREERGGEEPGWPQSRLSSSILGLGSRSWTRDRSRSRSRSR